jgi:hypothetical protein
MVQSTIGITNDIYTSIFNISRGSRVFFSNGMLIGIDVPASWVGEWIPHNTLYGNVPLRGRSIDYSHCDWCWTEYTGIVSQASDIFISHVGPWWLFISRHDLDHATRRSAAVLRYVQIIE